MKTAYALRPLAVVAAVAAVCASVGDVLLLTVAPGPAAAGPPAALLTGHYLGSLAIPLYALGYWAASRGLARTHPGTARLVAGAGFYAAALGGVVHGVTALALALTPAGAGDGPALSASAGPFLLPLWAMIAVAFVVGSAAFARAVASGTTAFPRWLALANPLALVLLVALSGLAVPSARSVIALGAPNFAHVVFFALVALAVKADPAR